MPFNTATEIQHAIMHYQDTLSLAQSDNIYEQLDSNNQSLALAELCSCFDEQGNLVSDSLADFLKEYWNKTRGTFLSYTAQPNSAFHKLLYDIATWEVSRKNKPAILLLMPCYY